MSRSDLIQETARPPRSRIGALAEPVWALATHTQATQVGYVLLSTICVQGAAYMLQFLLARILGAAGFGVVRSVESVLAVTALVAASGIPTLALKYAAEVNDVRGQASLLKSLLSVAVLSSLVAALLLLFLAGFVLEPSSAPYLRTLAGIVAVTCVARTCISFLQGRQEFKRLLTLNVTGSLATVIAGSFLSFKLHLWGWVAGRYLGEFCFLGFIVYALRRILFSPSGDLPNGLTRRGLWGSGALISSSMLLRSFLDNAGLLWLNWKRSPQVTIGNYGLAALICMALLIVPVAIGTVMLPRLIQASGNARLRRIFVYGMALSLAFLAAAALIFYFAAPLVPLMFGPSYQESAGPLRILLLGCLLRAFTNICGILLLAVNRIPSMLWMNVAVVGGMLSLIAFIPGGTGRVTAWCVVAMEFLSAALYGATSLRVLMRPEAMKREVALG